MKWVEKMYIRDQNVRLLAVGIPPHRALSMPTYAHAFSEKNTQRNHYSLESQETDVF